MRRMLLSMPIARRKRYGKLHVFIIREAAISTSATTTRNKFLANCTISCWGRNLPMLPWSRNGRKMVIKNCVVWSAFTPRMQIIRTRVSVEFPKPNSKKASLWCVINVGAAVVPALTDLFHQNFNLMDRLMGLASELLPKYLLMIVFEN